MSRAPTALRSIGGFGVAVACLSVAATAAVVVLVPEPAQPRMTGAEAIAALTGQANGLERRFGSPPEGPRALLLEEIIAAQMGRPSESVRAATAVFQPQPAPLAGLAKRLKSEFDPSGILNPGRMG